MSSVLSWDRSDVGRELDRFFFSSHSSGEFSWIPSTTLLLRLLLRCKLTFDSFAFWLIHASFLEDEALLESWELWVESLLCGMMGGLWSTRTSSELFFLHCILFLSVNVWFVCKLCPLTGEITLCVWDSFSTNESFFLSLILSYTLFSLILSQNERLLCFGLGVSPLSRTTAVTCDPKLLRLWSNCPTSRWFSLSTIKQ